MLARSREVVDAALASLAQDACVAPAGAGPRIREARMEDLAILVEFNRAMAEETEDKPLDRETLTSGLRRLLADPELGRYFVLEVDGRTVAALLLTTEWSDWRDGLFWWIQSVYVRPEARRQGHYRRLYEHVRRRAARHPDVCGLRLYVERENAPARRTYEALGMRETAYRLYETEL